MIYLRIVLFILGGTLLLAPGVLYWLHRFFENEKKNKDKIKKTGAYLASVKHKTDVPLYGKNHLGGGPTHVYIIKHLSRGRYEYIVDGKKYRIRHEMFVRKRKMPYMIPIVYMIRFPRIAIIRGENFLWIQSLFLFFIGFCFLFISIASFL